MMTSPLVQLWVMAAARKVVVFVHTQPHPISIECELIQLGCAMQDFAIAFALIW